MLPLETSVTMNLEIKEFPHLKAQQRLKNVKFMTSRDKFMQFTRDMKDAVDLMAAVKPMKA